MKFYPLNRSKAIFFARLFLILGAAAFVTLMMQVFVVQSFRIDSGSMKPALAIGDTVIVSKFSYNFGEEPKPGDIIAFFDKRTNDVLIKRVIAGPGQEVAVSKGRIYIDWKELKVQQLANYVEIYQNEGIDAGLPRCSNTAISLGDHCIKHRYREWSTSGNSYEILRSLPSDVDNSPPQRVLQDTYFVMGDNRDNSRDSRYPFEIGGLGLIEKGDVIGKVIFKFRLN